MADPAKLEAMVEIIKDELARHDQNAIEAVAELKAHAQIASEKLTSIETIAVEARDAGKSIAAKAQNGFGKRILLYIILAQAIGSLSPRALDLVTKIISLMPKALAATPK